MHKKTNSQDIAKALVDKFLVDVGRALVKKNLSRAQERHIMRLQDVGLIKLTKTMEVIEDENSNNNKRSILGSN